MNNSPLPRQFALDISHIPTPSLSNFLAGENLALHSTLQDLVKSWESNHPRLASENPLNQRWIYWWGPKGSGRTHLLSAIGIAAQELGLEYFPLTPNEPISWVSLEERLPSLSTSNQPSVITVDDVDRLDERLVASLFRILNEIQGSKAIHIFMAGNAAPGALKLREDLRTRLGWGLIFQTHLLGDDEKIQALQQAAQARGLVLSPDVLPWLLNRFYRDMPNLMALIDALDAYSLETKRAVTLPLVRELLQPK
ncbi:MAG: DnaA regulatory inactivator Hda [Polynucleobacter sp.]|jgi:DnaA family protein|uniref:DnaA regulatory inactivator Hda n=1 Tax=Polynucleobacter aenigmaticus TaxID=1743164 RepID=A0A254Q2P5_9BURK|nr:MULTISPECIES: DnaA regulatory inactivator Hda [Polynucleobacter]MDO8714021.1 DnaA regulatory inactivator Hda [Polynucleobacter sp.]OWS72758.1 DnaA regulatory inactivator Hda [Polynucleobacter aenigmaticus]